MILIEQKGNLFDAPDGYYLAHCISSDYKLGAGIAKQFVEIFNMRNRLFDIYPETGKVGIALLIDQVFNLVTKQKYYDKPTYETLTQALIDMKGQCQIMGINKIAMPKIGCGLDKLKWNNVKNLLNELFSDTDVEIIVYSLN